MKWIAAVLIFVPALALADEVFLRDAGSIEGRIVEQNETMIKIDIGGGIMGVPADRVERIVKGRTPLDDYDDRAAKLKPQDFKGWRDLGRWAAEKGLTAQSTRAYENVVAVNPDDPEARQALGFVQLEGRWVTEEESYRARGYVKYDNEWMTPAEAQLAQNDAAAEQARRESERRAQDAEIAQQEAESRAREAEERAREAEEELESRSYDYPVYWGDWGYGLTYWPSGPRLGNNLPPRVNPVGGRR